MALVLFDGFEVAPVTRNSAVVVNPVQSNVGRDGIGKCVQAPGTATSMIYPLTPMTTCIVGVGINVNVSLAGGTTACFTLYSDGSTTAHLTINFDGLGHLLVRRGTGTGTVIATSTQTMSFSVWHYVEMKATIDDATGTCIVKVDGATWINFVGDTRNAGTLTTISALNLALPGSAAQKFDDLYVLDGTGSAPYNDFLGERVIRPMRPNGPGFSTGLTPSSAVANWTTVDEDPWSPTADYNSGVTGSDYYAMSDVSGLTSVDAVQEVLYGLKTDSGAKNFRALARSAAGSGYEGPDQALSTTIAPYQSIIHMTDPGGVAWTQTNVNSCDFGVKVT